MGGREWPDGVDASGQAVWFDATGMAWYDRAAVWPPEAETMHQPVRCGFCGGVYDLGTVTVTGRYVDCSVWRTPCCAATADDRGETGWKTRQDYTRLVRPGRAHGHRPTDHDDDARGRG